MASDFFNDFFIQPIINPEIQGYNIVNTVVLLTIMVIAVIIIYIALRKKIVFDSKFFTALIPYIIFGISLRVIMHQIEAGLLALDGISKTANPLEIGFWFFTPGIWILTFVLVVIGLLIAGIWKKGNALDNKRLMWFGIIIAVWPLIFNFTHFNNWPIFLSVFALILLISYAICYAINRFTKYKILSNPLNFFIVLGQGFDGIASTVAISFFNFSEQHVVSNILLDIHPSIFVIVKLAIAVLIAWSLDDYIKDNPKRKNLANYIKVIIAILGFATGLASLFKLGII